VDSDLPVNLSAKDLRFIDITASSLVESLQVPYELRAPTHGLIAGILQGLSSIARIKKHSTQSFMQSDMEKKALESSALVDNNVTDLGVEINRRYSSIMVSYAKVDHAHS
jgi:hypothetical protein